MQFDYNARFIGRDFGTDWQPITGLCCRDAAKKFVRKWMEYRADLRRDETIVVEIRKSLDEPTRTVGLLNIPGFDLRTLSVS